MDPQGSWFCSAPSRWSCAPSRRNGEVSSCTCFENLDPFFSVRKQGSCFTTIEEDVQVDEALIFLSSFSVAFREEKRERGRYIYFHFIFSGLTLLGAARFFDLGIFALPGPDQERKSLPELIQEDFDNFRKLMTRSSSSENGSENKDDT